MSVLLAFVKLLSYAFQHGVRLRDGERKLEGLAAQVVVPLRECVRVQAADERVVAPPVDRPEEEREIRALVVEVRKGPDREEGGLGEEVDGGAVRAALE